MDSVDSLYMRMAYMIRTPLDEFTWLVHLILDLFVMFGTLTVLFMKVFLQAWVLNLVVN